MKELKIEVPEGYEIDKENSTFECIRFKPKKLTYADIRDKICHKDRDTIGWIEDKNLEKRIGFVIRPSNCPTLKQMNRLTAINQLMNVAYYFNEIVDKGKYGQYVIRISDYGKLSVFDTFAKKHRIGLVTFKTRESAEEAIKILGEETVKLAISL